MTAKNPFIAPLPIMTSEEPPRRGLKRVRNLFCRGCIIAAAHGGRGMRKMMRIALKTLMIAYFVFAALFLLLRYGVLPNVERYKPEIEQAVSQKIGRQIRFATLNTSWHGLNPQLALSNLVIQDQQGKDALVLPQVNAAVSWWSLAVLQLRFAKIEILHPSLQVRRTLNGSVEIAGFPIASQAVGAEDEAGLNWLLNQQEISIRDGKIAWDDETRSNPILNLSGVNLVVKSHWYKHQFVFQAKPPAQLAAPVDVRGDFSQSAFARKKMDRAAWSGDLYFDLRQADLPAIHHYVEFPVKLDKGLGSLRSWLRLEKGRLADFTADVRLLDVLGKFRKDLPVLDMAQVSGRIVASERALQNTKYLPAFLGQSGHSLALVNFSMQTRDGLVLPATTLKETFTPGENGQGEKVELYAKSLDLHSLANFAEHLPIPVEQRRILIDVAPKGVLKEFTARWQGNFPEISSYSIKGQFSNLEMQPQKAQLGRPKLGKIPAKAAVPAIPGFENLSGAIDANDKGGSFTLDSTDLALQLPSYFVDPVMPFKRLQMQARWQFETGDKLNFQVKQMDFQQDAAEGSLSGKHVIFMGPGQQDLGELDIVGRINGFDVKTINRYIPEHTPDRLRAWLSSALLDGVANDVTLKLKGRLADFPFDQKNGLKAKKDAEQGEFVVKGNLQNGKLNYLPNVYAKDGIAPFWPVIDSIKGSFIFERGRMEIRGDTASTNGMALSKVKAVIPDLLDHNPVLQIDGLANGNFQGMVNYVKASPVDDWIGNFFHDTVATGNAQLSLKLNLPLHSLHESKVYGSIQLNGVDTYLQPDLPLLSALTGRVDFNEVGLSLNNVKASMLGGAVFGNGGTQKDGSIKIKLDGVASGEGIKKHFVDFGLGLGQVLDGLSGESHYSTQINVKRHQTEVIVESTLQGLGVNLPAPLDKAMSTAMPLRFEITPEMAGDANEARDQIKLSVGSRLNAIYQRKKTSDKNAKWNVQRAAISVNAPAVLPESGLSVFLDTKALNIDEWQRILETASTVSTGSPTPKMGMNEGKPRPDIAQYVEPSAFSVLTDELFVFGKKIDKIVLGASNQSGLWQANLDSKQASGFVTWNGLGTPQNGGHILARLSRLMIPKSAASDVGDLLEGKNTTKQIPSLDIHVDNFELFDKKLGRLELFASNALSSSGREWSIDKLHLKNEDADLSASGKWLSKSNDSQTNLNYVLEISNAGKLLDRLDFNEILRGGKGRLEGDVQWTGLPFDLDIPSMSGSLQLKLSAGQFLKVDPGVGKLLGVLSMQSLPRRFTLDFRDVFSEGFAFDGISGTAQIQHGVAKTDNLKMNSVNATVLMEGSADIAKESQDLHVAVIPDFNAGAASVVYGIAVNPMIGLGTFLAQLFFRDPLKRAFTYEYQISGPWKNPIVAKIENKERQEILDKQKAEQAKNKTTAKNVE